MKTTRKKSKIIGEQQLFTADGEIISCHVVQIEERDANFHKIWLGHIIQSLDLIETKRFDWQILFWPISTERIN